jgi:uncharacterized membrane protein YbhN (UPF0104 family)
MAILSSPAVCIFDECCMTSTRKLATRWLVPAIGGVIALSALFFLYRSLDFDRFLDAVENANPWWVAVLAAAILAEQFIHGWKWRQLLHDLKPISSMRLTGALLAGYGANTLVPLGISPLVRSWLIARLEHLKMATVLMTTAISRFIDGIVFAVFAGVVAVAGQVPRIEGNPQLGLSVAGGLNLVIFAGLLWLLFRYQSLFKTDTAVISRLTDWLAARFGGKRGELRAALWQGIIWPKQASRQIAVLAASFAMKMVAATHFLWAGLAVGVVLGLFDYLFLMVFAGFALVLTRFIRVPGGFVIGSGFALKLLGVPDEQALAMILFTHIMTIILVVFFGLIILWQSGIDIRSVAQSQRQRDATT